MLQISRTGCIIRENPLKLRKRRRKASGIHPRPLSPRHRIGNQPDRQAISYADEARGVERNRSFSTLSTAVTTVSYGCTGNHLLASVSLPTSPIVACGAHPPRKADYPQHTHSIPSTSPQRPLLFGHGTVLNVR